VSIRRQGKIYVSDASVTVTEESVAQDALKAQVMLRLCRYLKDQGWEFHVPYADYDWIHKDRQYTKNRPHFAESMRKGIKDGLEMELRVSGRCLEIKFWEDINDHSADNSNGGRYIFDKESKMPYRQRCRVRATKIKILKFLTDFHDYELRDGSKPILPRRITGMEFLKKSYKESWHHDEDIYSEKNSETSYHNSRSADGDVVKHGQKVWTTDYSGRWISGIAFRNLNNMWWVLCGKWDKYNKASFDIYCHLPIDIKNRMPKDVRVKKLKSHLAKAISAEDFLKCHALKQALNEISEEQKMVA